MFSGIFRHKQSQNIDLKQLALLKLRYYNNLEKTFTVYQRNACKSIIDDRGRAGFRENDLCQKKTLFAAQDLRVTVQHTGNNTALANTENHSSLLKISPAAFLLTSFSHQWYISGYNLLFQILGKAQRVNDESLLYANFLRFSAVSQTYHISLIF